MKDQKAEENADQKRQDATTDARAALEAWIKNYNAWCHDQLHARWQNEKT